MNVQEAIITYIYQQIPLKNFRYKILKDKDDLSYLRKNQHYIAPNYYGHNNLLVLTKIGTNFYSFFIDRKTLTYSKDKLDISRVIIKKIKIFAAADLYNGTILDGILVNNNKKQTFIITDAYYVSGKSFLNIDYKTKMQQLKNIISKKIKKSDAADDIEYYVDDVKTYIDLETMADIKKNKINTFNEFNSRGLIFYPSISGKKFIYTINNNQKNLNKNSIHESKHESKKDVHVKFKKSLSNKKIESDDESSSSDSESSDDDSNKKTNYKSPKKEIGTFLMKKTITSDIYDLCLNNDSKKVKIGIAYIPSISASKKCREFFEDDVNEVIVNCHWHEKFTKWIPDDLSKKKVDSVETIYG